MAQRRMFSKDITGTDAFLEMPVSSQLLYFQLGMEADDDGFVGSPKKVSRMIGAGDDDLKVLSAKRFILPFESGVVVIKHWKINNYIQKDRYHETKYLKEKEAIITKKNGSYTECIQNSNKMDTEVRVRLGKSKSNIATKVALCNSDDLVYEPLKGNKTRGAFLDRARAKKGKPPMLKKDPSTWGIINFYRRQYKYITGNEPEVGDADYFHILSITKKMSPKEMEEMIVWYIKLDNKKFKDHPQLKSIFTIENVNKFKIKNL